MSEPALDLATTATKLTAAFPDAGAIAPLRLLGAGFRSMTVETAGRVVFRIGRNAAAAEGYAREARLLPALRATLPAPIPDPRWQAGPCVRFPFGALGYPALAGVPLSPERLAFAADVGGLADAFARFLVALHGAPLAPLAGVGLPGPAVRWAGLVRMRDVALPALRGRLTAGELAVVAGWWERFVADEALRGYAPALVHGDFWHENLLVDAACRELTGVLDFEQAAIADPAQDLATLRHLGRPFADRVLAAYRAARGRADATLEYRVGRLWELRELDGVAFAAEQDDRAELEDAVQKLRRGPLFRVAGA